MRSKPKLDERERTTRAAVELASLLNSLVGNRRMRETPVELQLHLLGLDPKSVLRLRGKRVLDLACGQSGALVKYLRSKGVDAEGIDPAAPDGPHFTRLEVMGMKQSGKGIPRPDGHYKLIVSFQNGLLNHVFKGSGDVINRMILEDGGEEVRDRHTHLCMAGQCMVLEMARTVAANGSAITFPSLPRLRDLMGLSFAMGELAAEERPVDQEALAKYLGWEVPWIEITDAILKTMGTATVLRKG